ncbi:MAG: hypothetical protein C0402_13420 [Thermodesulfovibrio sp.]|nr:hypothetical protein [Thermodesulfovibrio sp.]
MSNIFPGHSHPLNAAVFFYFSLPQGILLALSQSEETTISFILIDGYNLIGTAHNDLQAERSRLVRQLSAYHKTKGHDITVVFDGWQAGGLREETTIVAGVKVIYSRLGDKADLVIKRIMDTAAKELIVITSDRDIMAHAWAKGCVPVQSRLFEPCLAKSSSPHAYVEESGDEDEPEIRRGNPRMPSRREKALTRVLKKLC